MFVPAPRGSLFPCECPLSPDVDIANHQNQQKDEQFNQPEHFELVQQDGQRIKRDNFNIKDNKQHARQEILHGKTPFGRFNFLNAAFIRCELLRRWFLGSKKTCQDHDQRTKEDSKRNQNKNGECSHGRDPSFLYMIICRYRRWYLCVLLTLPHSYGSIASRIVSNQQRYREDGNKERCNVRVEQLETVVLNLLDAIMYNGIKTGRYVAQGKFLLFEAEACPQRSES